MIKILKMYYIGLLGINEGRHTKDKGQKWRKLSMPFILAYTAIVFGGMYAFQTYQNYRLLEPMGMVPQLLALGVVLTLAFCLFGAWSKSVSLIYMSQDLPFWLSSPLSTRQVFLGKVLTAYSFDVLLALFFMAPPLFFVGRWLGAGPGYYLLGAAATVILPLPAFILGTVLGMGTQMIFKGTGSKKTLIQIVLATLAVLLATAVSFMAATEAFQNFWQQFMEILTLNRWLGYLANHYITLLLVPAPLNIFLYFALHLAAAVFFIQLGTQTYFPFLNTIRPAKTAQKVTSGTFRSRSAFSALYRREFKRYFTSTVYVLNTSFGFVMLLAGTVYLVWQRHSILEMLPTLEQELNLEGMGNAVIIFAIIMLVAMAPTTTASISLEGKGLGLLKSFPIPARTIFAAKAALNLTLAFISLAISLPLLFWAFSFTIPEIFLAIWLSAGYTLSSALMGLLANLRLPNLDWQSEVTAVKQSAGVMVGVFGNMLLVAGPIFLAVGVFSLGPTASLGALAVYITLLNLFWLWALQTFGIKWFERM